MDPKLLVVVSWMALIGAALITLALQSMGRLPPGVGLLVVLPLCLLVFWAMRRARRP